MAPAVLGYWNTRGLGESIRYLLHYLQIEFEDKRYEFGPAPNYFDSEWSRNDKKNLGLEFPNMPYYIDGDFKITQSLAIMRHLGRKHHLYYPTNENDLIRFETVEGQALDFQQGAFFLTYNPNFEQLKEKFYDNYIDKIKQTADFLGEKKWLFGEDISHVDFILFENLDKLKLIFPGCCDSFENLVKYFERFASLPGVEEYRKTSAKWPLYSPLATFGWKKDYPQ